MTSKVGDVLASKYRLEQLLGSGGMGHVYRAVNVEIERAVAIKVLRSEHATNAPIVERFLREARAANLVRHPNVVDVVDIGRDGDGSPFIVQELLEGEDLARYTERRGGKLTLHEVEEYLLPVIDAVAEAHARGVVHRDIKPDNVFLAQIGSRRVPKLLDFGISKLRLPNIKATEVGMMMGTPAYMPPEQVQGSHDADPRTDVWALGVMLFELLSGHLPFEGADAPALFVAIATKDAPELFDVCPEVGPDVSRVVERCLRRMPDERYPTALELARDLRHVLEGEDIEPTQTRSIPQAPALPPRSPLPVDVVPDLILPPSSSKERKDQGPKAAKTISGRPPDLALGKTELSVGAPVSRAPAPVPDLDVPPPRSSQRIAAVTPAVAPLDVDPPRSSQRIPAVMPSVAPLDVDPPRSSQRIPAVAASVAPAVVAVPASQPSVRAPPLHPPASAGRLAADQALPGVMLAGSSTSQRRPTANVYLPEHPRQGAAAPPPDMILLVALAVVGLTSIGTTAVLMSFVYRPEGWPLLALVTKPAGPLNLAVQGGLATVAFVVAARLAISGVRKWRGVAEGGRGSAVMSAIFAGAFFFAALQLARAAW